MRRCAHATATPCHDPLVERAIADLVTHYHLESRRPLLNPCDLPQDRFEHVVAELEPERAAGLLKAGDENRTRVLSLGSASSRTAADSCG